MLLDRRTFPVLCVSHTVLFCYTSDPCRWRFESQKNITSWAFCCGPLEFSKHWFRSFLLLPNTSEKSIIFYFSNGRSESICQLRPFKSLLAYIWVPFCLKIILTSIWMEMCLKILEKYLILIWTWWQLRFSRTQVSAGKYYFFLPFFPPLSLSLLI
jgi:hypothetical protein